MSTNYVNKVTCSLFNVLYIETNSLCHMRVPFKSAPTSGTNYMFVVRAMVGTETHEPDPNDKHSSRIYRIFNLCEALPEFLVSYKVMEPSSD